MASAADHVQGVVAFAGQRFQFRDRALIGQGKAVEYGEKMSSGAISPYYMAAMSQLIEILEKDKDANAAEIAKLKKAAKELSKKLK